MTVSSANERGQETRKQAPLEWLASRKDQRIKLHGAVASPEDRVIVLGMVKAMFADHELDDQTRVMDAPASDGVWLSGVSYALRQLKRLDAGVVKLNGRDVTIGGRALTVDQYQTINSMAAAELPADLRLTSVNIVPPVAEPFLFAARIEGNGLVLEGHMPNEETRRQIGDLAASLFPKRDVTDRLELASGAPDRWIEAAGKGLSGLRRLSEGTVSISARDVHLRGIAATKAAVVEAEQLIRQGLPTGFRWTEPKVALDTTLRNVAPQAVDATGAPPAPFAWRAERREGKLILSGDVPSETVRGQLIAAVRVGYPGAVLEDRMVVAPGAPGRWLDAAALGVEQLGRLEEGYVFMTDRALSIVGRLNPGEDVGAFEKSFAESLPGGFRGSHALAVQRPAEVEKAERCQDMIDEVLGDQSIAFHGGSARVVSTSKPVLEQLARIAGTCPNSVIEIAARPDAGADPVDRALVQERAQSVLAHMADHGVRNMRLGYPSAASQGAPSTSDNAQPGKQARVKIQLQVRAN